MPIRGPLGLRRPFASEKVIIDFRQKEVELKRVGPLGITRPFAWANPGVTAEQFEACMRSRGANAFAEGITGRKGLETPEDVYEAKRSWCMGILEAINEEAEGEEFPPIELIPEDLTKERILIDEDEVQYTMNQTEVAQQ